MHVFLVKPERPDCQIRPRSRYGTYSELASWLTEMNEAGCAIFVQVQEGTSAKATSITRARAFFLDFDTEEFPRSLPLPPTLTVRTGKGWHVYYQITATRELEDWEEMQKGLARKCGADLSCTKRNQKARLCGYFHQKDGRRSPVRIESYREERGYTLDNFELFLHAPLPELAVIDPANFKAYYGTWSFPLLRERLRNLLKTLRSAVKGERFTTLQRVAFQFGCYAAVGLDASIAIAQMRKIVHGWEDYDQRDGARTIAKCFQQGYDHGRTRPPSTPVQQMLEFERQERRAEFIDRLMEQDWGNRISVGEILQTSPDWPEAFQAEGSARRRIARLLREKGYEERRTKLTRFYVLRDKNLS